MRRRYTPDMRSQRFQPDQHWRKSSQWFTLNRKWVAWAACLVACRGWVDGGGVGWVGWVGSCQSHCCSWVEGFRCRTDG